MSPSAKNALILVIILLSTIGSVFLTLSSARELTPDLELGSIAVQTNADLAEPMSLTNTDSVLSTTTNISRDKILFVGDIMLGRHVEQLINENGSNYPFSGNTFSDSYNYHAVGNFEAAVPFLHQKTPNYNFRFSVAKSNLLELKNAGFTHLSLANNHTFDYGESGLNETEEVFKELPINTFGQPNHIASSSVTYISISGLNIASIAVNTISNSFLEEDLLTIVDEASQESDIQIVYIHWGEEYEHEPTNFQLNLAKKLAAADVEIIIGHHPHVVQSIEKIGNTMVFYSLGNYIFDQYFSRAVQESFILAIEVVERELVFTIKPITSLKSQARPVLMDHAEASVFLDQLANYSELNLKSQITTGQLRLSI